MQLTPFFKMLIEKRWSEFCEMEADESQYTSAQAVVFAIVRACAKGKLPAIKESLNRIDGRLHEQIEVEYPQFYILFPHAKSRALPDGGTAIDVHSTANSPDAPPDPMAPLITGSLRDTLERMSQEPRALVTMVLQAAEEVEARKSYAGDPPENNPLVKSVIAAGLLKLAHNGSLGAIFEVFDNIDGKLVDKIKVLGEDVYLTDYREIAPAAAKKNKDGVYQISADNTTSSWALALGKKEDKLL